MSENTGSRTLPFPTTTYHPPHLSRQERKKLAKEKGRKFIPQADPPTDAVAQQLIQHRTRITTQELAAMKESDSGK